MVASPGARATLGQPRSDADAAFLKRFDAVMRIPLIVSAILPIVVSPEQDNVVSLIIGVLTWLVFLVDYVVHLRRVEHFGRTGFGRFDLAIVVVTAPWFLLPGAHGGGFVVVLRLARLARLLVASRGSRQLFERLGRVAGVAIGVLVTASFVAYYAEHATNPEFATVGDAMWWGMVTLTTVGYGDVVPKTPTGRWAAVVIMVTGIAVLGVLAGSLAGFLRLDADRSGSPDAEAEAPGRGATAETAETETAETETAGTETAGPTAGGGTGAQLGALVGEVAALRRQVATLTERVAELGEAARSSRRDDEPR